MSVAETRTRYTPDDLLAMPEGKFYELVDGELVVRDMSGLSSLIAARLIRFLDIFGDETGLAWVFGSDCGYQCFPGQPGKLRRPDASAVLRERLPAERLDEGYFRFAPDLVAEVVSPNDLAYQVQEKVRDYLGAGVRLVWVIYPPTRVVEIYRLDGTVGAVAAEDELRGEDVLPGFRCRVGDLFPPAAAAAQA